jgi:hypothetical protein
VPVQVAGVDEFCAAGRLRTVCGWLDALDPAGLADYPPLAITAAWIFAFSGDPLRAQQCIHVAERGSFEGPLPDGSISLTSAIGVLRAVMGGLGVDRMLLDATAAVDLPLALGSGRPHAGPDLPRPRRLRRRPPLGRGSARASHPVAD